MDLISKLETETQKTAPAPLNKEFTMSICHECGLKFQPLKWGIRAASNNELCCAECAKAVLEKMFERFKSNGRVNPLRLKLSSESLMEIDQIIKAITALPNKNLVSNEIVPVYLRGINVHKRLELDTL